MDFRNVSRDAVLAAIDEFDRVGRDQFLEKYGFGPARDYIVVHEGREYDSKALLGAAFGYDHPEHGPLRHQEFQGGAGTVAPALSGLGFRVIRRSGPNDAAGQRVWIIRAGSEGESEALALQEHAVVLGWTELGRLSAELSLDELKAKIRSTYGEERPQSLAAQAGQIYRFIHEVQDDDLAVLPLRSRPNHVAVGRIVGPYSYREDGPFIDTDAQNTREVDWLETAIPYERFDPDLREAFGQRGTLSEISKPEAPQRIMDVLEGADASAIHLVLKWSPALEARTIQHHQEVADERGAVWWGRVSKPGATGLGNDWLVKLREQLARGSVTHVFLHSAASTWRTRLLAITLDRSEVEEELIPPYYKPETHHSLWVKVTDFEQTDPSELTEGFVLAQSGDPVTAGGLGNQTPLIVRMQSALRPGRYFILNQGAANHGGYDDEEGVRYHWTERSSGAWKQLANSPGAGFVCYRPGTAADETGQTYFGTGRIASVNADEREDGLQHFVADIEDFHSFETPVPWKVGPPRNAQTSIQPITRVQFEKLIALGLKGEELAFDVETVRSSGERHGLNLASEIYEQLLAALNSGKHVILTGPPGTAKTTLAQAVAEAARDAGRCAGYTLTTATADWTTFETIGGLRPTRSGELEFEEGHFLKAIRERRWLVIDELNRSNFDRAFGQLFTVLSGQPVVLPHYRPGRDGRPLTLVPEGKESPVDNADLLEIPQSWRIVATMNVFDKTLLFEMSFALMRRFAFVEVASPSIAVFEALIDRETGGEAAPADVAKRLLVLRTLKDLGPAVFMDIARYVRARMANDFADEGQLLFESFYSYLLPQFEGVDDAQGEALFTTVAPLVGSTRQERLRRTLNSVLGLELAGPKEADPEANDVDDEAPVEVTEETP